MAARTGKQTEAALEATASVADELATAERVLTELSLSSLSNPVKAALAGAPKDDEPVTEQEAERIKEGERDLREGRTFTSEQVRKRLGA